MIRSTLSLALALGALTLIAASPARAQDASEIIDRMLEEYEARAQGIDDYTLVQTFMGFETVSYVLDQKKPVVDISFFPEGAEGLQEKAQAAGVP